MVNCAATNAMKARWKAVLLPLAAALALAPLAGCAASQHRPFRLVPAPYPDYSIEDGLATVRAEGFRLTVAPLDDIARAAFIKARAAGGIDPFQPEKSGAPNYLTFRLAVENLSAKDTVAFQPQNIMLASENGDRIYPLDYPQAYTLLMGSASSDPRLVEDLSKYLFDIGVSIAPGGRAEGLLVYPAPKAGTSKFRLEFSFIQVGGAASASFDIFFTKEALP